MRVLVTGGTGFIGSHLIDKLVKQGHHVRCLLRRTSQVAFLKTLNVELLKGDFTDERYLKRGVEGVDIVFNLIGILGRWGISDEVYWETNLRATERLLSASLQSDIEQFIHCSSAGVVGPLRRGAAADEKYPYNPSNIYEETKSEAERIAVRYYEENGIPMTVLRPEFVYGPRDLHVLSLFKSIQRGRFLLIGGGKTVLHPTYIDDVVQGFMLCVGNKKTIGEIYFIAGERTVTVQELSLLIANALDVPPPRRQFPTFLSLFLARLFERSANMLKFDPPLTVSMVRFFTENRSFSTEKARKHLNYNPVLLEEGLRRTVTWYRENGFLK